MLTENSILLAQFDLSSTNEGDALVRCIRDSRLGLANCSSVQRVGHETSTRAFGKCSEFVYPFCNLVFRGEEESVKSAISCTH